MSSSIFRIPAAAAAAVFLLSAFQPVSADIYTDEHVIEQTKEDIVKLKKLLPSKSANGVTLIHLYTMNKPWIARKIFENLSEIIGA